MKVRMRTARHHFETLCPTIFSYVVHTKTNQTIKLQSNDIQNVNLARAILNFMFLVDLVP
jgi:hypothetical protein